MKKKLNLCLISPVPPPYGGIANWSNILKEHIQKEDNINISIIDISPKKRKTEKRYFFKDRIIKNGIKLLKQSKNLINLLKNDDIDVIHLTTSGRLSILRDLTFLIIAKKMNIPVVYHIHFGRIREISKNNNLEWKLLSIAMKLSTKVISIDKITYSVIENKFNNIDVVYIPNPIKCSNFCKPIKNDNIVMFLGWVIKEKGIEELLIGWNYISSKYNNWILKIVGPYNKKFLTKLKRKYSLEKVIFEGEKTHDEAMNLLSKSSIFILPSYTEGFPNVILEAMSMAKPIIATNVGAIPDILSKNCGIIIESQSIEDIKTSIDQLIIDEKERKKIGLNAYKKLKKNYIIDIVFEQYFEIWNKLKR